jgi:flagellar hook-basal body complex protein FliE
MIDPISTQLSALSRTQPQSPAFIESARPVQQTAVPDDFSSMISQMIAETANALHKAEATSVDAIAGNGSVQGVVQAVMTAEQSLQAAIAVRDKVTAAYLELSRMGI